MSVFGPVFAPQNLEDAILAHLRVWMPYVLADLEDQNDLERGTLFRPPHTSSFYGGVDFDSWQQDDLPAYIVTVKPDGDPDHSSSTGYSQAYNVGIAVVVVMQSEADARRLAGFHGTAAMVPMVQRGSLGGIAASTTLTRAPEVVLPDLDETRIARCEATYRVVIDTIVNDWLGPGADLPEDSPVFDPDADDTDAPWTDWPTVETVTATVTPVEEIDP